MKANEAPEKIYVHVKKGKTLNTWNNEWIGVNDIEYTRTDAVIEKACSGIEKLLSGYIIRNFHFGDSYDIDRLIEDFKNYMKGE
jgi:hypothetical protein